jgi:methionyl-tRNA synthetase
VYVWFDALTNYVSALGFGDPESADFRTWWVDADERVHVIGKGILRFHAVYWPAFLASAGVPLPTRIQVHPYLTVDGDKISKSSGSRADPALVDPAGVVEAYGADALRWWFARDVASVADTDYTTERLVARANEDLAHGLGNVTNRVVALVHRYRGGVVPSVDAAPVDGVADLDGAVLRALTDFELRAGARLVVDAVTALNRDLETTRPWDVAKRDGAGDSRTLDALLARHIRTARLIARAAAPIVPDLAARLRDQLGADGSRLGPPDGAFARLDRP